MYGIVNAIPDTMITLQYTFLKNAPTGSLIMRFKKASRARRQICDMIIAAITVTSGKYPILSRTYDTGKFISNKPPTTI